MSAIWRNVSLSFFFSFSFNQIEPQQRMTNSGYSLSILYVYVLLHRNPIPNIRDLVLQQLSANAVVNPQLSKSVQGSVNQSVLLSVIYTRSTSRSVMFPSVVDLIFVTLILYDRKMKTSPPCFLIRP